MNEKELREIEAMADKHKHGIENNSLFPCEIESEVYALGVYARTTIPALTEEVRRLRAVLAEYADKENWIRSLVAPNTLSEKCDLWLPIEHGYTRAENALKDGG